MTITATMDDLPLQKISILGPTLASLIQRASSSPADSDGLLFGHFSYSTPSTLSDDDSSSSSSSLSATITSFICLGTPGSVSSLLSSLSSSHHLRHNLIGWFSSRRLSPLRPFPYESSLTASLSSDQTLTLPIRNSSSGHHHRMQPCVFLLFSTPVNKNLTIHTHEYRAYQFRTSSGSFEQRSIKILNLGPGFGDHYRSFSPNSDFSLLPCKRKGSTMVYERRESRSARESKIKGFGLRVEDFRVLMGMKYTSGVEDAYEKMLREFESLARVAEESSARVLALENRVSKLRTEVAGIRSGRAD